jgi:small nuclear ribonucleoprotein (snRNP)-like protein
MLEFAPRACALALVALVVGSADAAEIDAIGGTYDETLVAMKPSGGRLVAHTRQREIPLESIKTIRWQGVVADDALATVVLLNGDHVRGALEGGNEDAIGLRSAALGNRMIPLEEIRAILPPEAGERAAALLAELRDGEEVDWVRLANGGTVKGSVVSIDGTRVTVDTDADGGSRMGEMAFDLDKVVMVSIAPLDDPPGPPAGVSVVVRLTDGSSLAGELEAFQNDTLSLRHRLGGKGTLGIQRAKLAQLVVRGGSFVYLSDVEPADVQQRFPADYTYEVDVWGYKRDRNVTGGVLRLDGRAFEKGLGVHSYCALTYPLEGGFKEFKVVVGLDDSVRYLGEPGFGAVVFKVLLDGKPAKECATGIVVRKGDKARALRVDVSKAKKLTLVADFDPTSLHVLGRANWADAHLIRGR